MRILLLLALLASLQTYANLPPTIGGTPSPTAIVGQAYSFTPIAKDPEGKKLYFTMQGRPPWMKFSYSTGTLSGTPTAANVGLYSNIRIFVDDGPNTAVGTKRFSITVLSPVNGVAKCEWQIPTRNSNGTVLTDLAGYRIFYGTSPDALTKMVEIKNPAASIYVIDNLEKGTWYFAIRAYNSSGAESRNSGIASLIIG